MELTEVEGKEEEREIEIGWGRGCRERRIRNRGMSEKGDGS